MRKKEVLKSSYEHGKPGRRWRAEVTYDICLSLYLQIQETIQYKAYTRVSNFKNIFMVLEHC